jgi:hypothetical protein
VSGRGHLPVRQRQCRKRNSTKLPRPSPRPGERFFEKSTLAEFQIALPRQRLICLFARAWCNLQSKSARGRTGWVQRRLDFARVDVSLRLIFARISQISFDAVQGKDSRILGDATAPTSTSLGRLAACFSRGPRFRHGRSRDQRGMRWPSMRRPNPRLEFRNPVPDLRLFAVLFRRARRELFART